MAMDRHKMKIDYLEQHTYDNMKITIEEQLHLYEKHPERNERNAVLWHAWQQNKRWLIQLLELTIASFPAYSRHNASHAKAVLYNIERILGEERIKRLEPTDCFALLHVVYIHDIGMAILADDREEMVSSDEFAEMVDELTQDSDYDLKRAALDLQRISYRQNKEGTLIDRGGEEYLSEQKIIYREKFNTYYAIIQLMSEFQRGKHGERAGSRISSWITDQDKLRSEFAMSGIPMRIFLRIADCASLHTDWDFQHILDLPFEENGYEHDMLHPRFVAVLLQLGDALDIDNDRFHPFAHAFLGKLPMQSQAHYDKHMAIRTLKVTPEEIRVEADCVSREALRLVRNECDALEKLLESSSYHWSSIAPRELGGALPTLQMPRLLLNGREIPPDLAMMRFRISQRKAFSLLQGENIYSGRFPFVRELLQNAIDSTKIQCWSDYTSSSKFRYKRSSDEQTLPSILEVAQIVNPIEYPVEIEIRCGKMSDKNEWEEVEFGEIQKEDGKNEQYGILFCIRDYGTGISTEVLRDIAEVGTSYKKRKKKLRNIPEWLRPTGEFGIGLQSVFLVSDSFSCETHTRSGERYRIEFRTGANGEHGYINVEPKNAEQHAMPFGSEFEVFISHRKKKERDEFIEAWQGYDPFDSNYENGAVKRDIVELTAQLLLDIDRQLGELLFPVYVHVAFPFEEFYRVRLDHKIVKVVLDTSVDFQEHTEERMKKHVSWIYNYNGWKKGNFLQFEMSNGICTFDFKNMNLYMWLENISTCARLGVERILGRATEEKKLCQIFFKGIWAEEATIAGDAELLEMIDIKGGKMENNYLQLNRNGFTSRGQEHIEKEIVPEILKSAREALGIIARETCDYIERPRGNIKERFEDFIGKYFKEELRAELTARKKTGADWREQLLGISLFYHFYMMYSEESQKEYVSSQVLEERERWKQALKKVKEVLNENSQKIEGNGKMDIVMNMSVPFVQMTGVSSYVLHGVKRISVADFFDHSNHFLLISRRREEGDGWFNYLVRLIEKDETNDQIKEFIRNKKNDIRDLKCSVRSMIQFQASTEYEIRTKKSWLETWGQYVIQNVAGFIEENVSVEQSAFLQKLLKYVPILGCFSDITGNIRIHVMNGTGCEYIFYDNCSKYMCMRKMVKRHTTTNAERFVLFPYCEFQMLGITEYPKDACSVHDRYVYDMEYRMLFPCSGRALKQMLQEYENIKVGKNLRQIGMELKRICNFQFEYYRERIPGLKEKFDEKRIEYSSLLKKPCSEEQFIRVLKMGYGMLLEHLARSMVMRGEEKSLKMTLPDSQKIQEKADLLCEAVLDHFEFLVVGRRGEYGKSGEKFKEDLDYLVKCVMIWNQRYKEELEEKVRNCVRRTCKNYWKDSQERELLVEWTVRHSQYSKDIISEMYERLWQDIEETLQKVWRANEDILDNWEILEIIKKGVQ